RRRCPRRPDCRRRGFSSEVALCVLKPALAPEACGPGVGRNMTTRILLIDRALVRIGADPLGSESAPGAETHIATYQDVIEDLLTRHPWHFNTQVRQLNRLQAQP